MFGPVMLPLLWCRSEFPPKYPDDDCAKTGDWAEPGALLFAIFAMLAAFRAAICFSKLGLWNIPDVPIPESCPCCVSEYDWNMRLGEPACPWFCCLTHTRESAKNKRGTRKKGNSHCALNEARGEDQPARTSPSSTTSRGCIPPSSQFLSLHFLVSSRSRQPAMASE